MNWRNIFIAGMVLSLSPFTLRVDSFLFIYALLGYGLTAVSYIYKKQLSKWDAVIIANLVCIVLTGLSNIIVLYHFFEYLFLLILFVCFAKTVKDETIRLVSLPMIGVMGVLFSFYIGSFFGFKAPFDIAVFLYYFAFFIAGSVFILGYKKMENGKI